MTRQPRPEQIHQTTRLAPAPSYVPSVLQGNGSISISKVDMTRKCNLCSQTFPNPSVLVEHMNRNHFKSLGGINIVSKGDNDAQKSEHQERTAQQYPVQTPSSYTVQKHNLNPKNTRNYPNQTTHRQMPSNVSRMPNNFHAVKNNVQRKNKPHSPAQGFRQRTPEVVKCNVCAKTIEKSKLSVHKLSHTRERKNEKTNMIKAAQKNKSEEMVKIEKKPPAPKVSPIEEVELVDLEDEDTDMKDADISQPERNTFNTPLPHESFKQARKIFNVRYVKRNWHLTWR